LVWVSLALALARRRRRCQPRAGARGELGRDLGRRRLRLRLRLRCAFAELLVRVDELDLGELELKLGQLDVDAKAAGRESDQRQAVDDGRAEDGDHAAA
jgi:hypothetical protein